MRAMREAGMEAWSKMLIDLVNSPAYADAQARYLDNWLAASAPFQQAVERAMTQVLAGLNMPTRADVTSLAERLTNIEFRLDDLDAKIDALSTGKEGE
jgi:polyhydroxyalkanoate synthesis regulator phasin